MRASSKLSIWLILEWMYRLCPSGGIGRRSGFKIRRLRVWEFESPLGHQYIHIFLSSILFILNIYTALMLSAFSALQLCIAEVQNIEVVFSQQ